MKLIITIPNKITNNILIKSFLLLLFFNMLLLLLYKSIHIECEPCLPDCYCEPCICKEQYFIVYFGCCMNIIGLICSMIIWKKLRQFTSTDKILMLVYFVFINMLLYLSFKDFQSICVPCLDDTDCPPCISEEQYILIYFGIAINVILCVFCAFKSSILARVRLCGRVKGK